MVNKMEEKFGLLFPELNSYIQENGGNVVIDSKGIVPADLGMGQMKNSFEIKVNDEHAGNVFVIKDSDEKPVMKAGELIRKFFMKKGSNEREIIWVAFSCEENRRTDNNKDTPFP